MRPNNEHPGVTGMLTATAREIRAELRAMRLEQQNRLETAQNWYMAIAAVLILGSMAYAQFGAAFSIRSCTTPVCSDPDARGVFAVAVGCAVAAAGMRLLRMTGPLGADPAMLTWLHSSPVRRAGLLLPGLVGQTGLAAALGASVGGLVALVAGHGLPAPVVWPLLAGGAALGVALCAVGVVAQARPRLPHLLNLLELALVVAAGGLAIVATSAGTVTIPRLPGLLAMVAVVAGAGLLGYASSILDEIPATQLRRGGEVQGAAVSATLMMDPSVVATYAQGRRAVTSGRFASRALQGTGSRVFLTVELRRLRRRPWLVLGSVLSGFLPGVVTVFSGRLWGHVVAALVLAMVGRALAGGVAAWCQSSGLRRLIPLPTKQIRVALTIPATVVLVAWAAVTIAVGGLGWWEVLPFVVGGMCALLRAAEPVKPADFSLLLSTPAGAVPIGLFRQVTDGAMEAIICVMAAMILQPVLAAPTAVIVLLITVYRASWK